jgi:hypothetical protein
MNDFFDSEPVEDKPSMYGFCTSCFGSGFRIEDRDGVFGVVYTMSGNDESTRTLLRCDCGID